MKQNQEPKAPKIETGIPVPKKTRQSVARDTLAKMKAGDSVLVGAGQTGSYRTFAKQLGCKITTRPEGKDHERVWRL